MEMRFNLDPIMDGPILNEKREEKRKGALIIATNGMHRIADFFETVTIIDQLYENGKGGPMGRTPYVIMFDGDKVLDYDRGKCFIGSAIIMKYDMKKGVLPLKDEEIDEAIKEFESRLITLAWEGQEYSAYDL